MRQLGGQPLGQHHLLLVAAGEPGRRRVGAGRADAEALEVGAGRVALGAAPDEPEARQPRRASASVVLLARAHRQHEPLALAILGHEADAERHRRRRACGSSAGCPRTRIRAGRVRIEPEQRLRDLGAPGADQAGEPEHLAGAQR